MTKAEARTNLMRQATQWIVREGGVMPSPITTHYAALQSGMYNINLTMAGPVFQPRQLETDILFNLPGSPAYQLVENVRKFWTTGDTFAKLGLTHKRGVLLHGAPGGGKTATAEILAQDVIAGGGCVLAADSPHILDMGLVALRAIEPTRKVVVIIEDVDELMGDGEDYDGHESALCRLLDGENQVDNVVYVATTNHLDVLPARFANRPSRFDEVLEIGTPSLDIRLAYLGNKIPLGMLDDAIIARWAADTEGLMIAHLRELIVGCLALGRPYEEVLGRLRAMGPAPSTPDATVARLAKQAMGGEQSQAEACRG